MSDRLHRAGLPIAQISPRNIGRVILPQTPPVKLLASEVPGTRCWERRCKM
jgi:hypothetical protein